MSQTGPPSADRPAVVAPPLETVFTWGAPPIKFGAGALDEVGADVAAMGLRRVAIVTDRGVLATGLVARVERSLTAAGVESVCFADVHVEPTDASVEMAAAWAREAAVDGFVAVGGGSAIDTAKAMNLLSTNEGTVLTYLNPPIGEGRAPTRPLKPLIAVPTTAGTGSESTAVCVVDVLALRVKTGMGNPALRPRLAIVDPSTTLTLTPEVTASSGMDILCHALESYTAIPFDGRPRHVPGMPRPVYNGSNPISDLWATRALELLGQWFRRAVNDPDDVAARDGMMQAATYAGIGFGNAGVHVPHACGYPIAGMVRSYRPAGYDVDHAMVPHGQSVVATAPAVFRFTYPACPGRHDAAARLLTVDQSLGSGPEALPDAIVALCRDVRIPNGLTAFGYGAADVPGLVAGAARQQRILAISPRPVTEDDLAAIFRSSLTNW